MGARLTNFNLYALQGCEHRYLLARAERPEFPNASQRAEDAAVEYVEERFARLVAHQKLQLEFETAALIGTWEGGFPSGDVFYGRELGLEVTIWFATESTHRRYFAFGIAETESAFWADLHELHADGDLWGFDEFTRPAFNAPVWFVSSAED